MPRGERTYVAEHVLVSTHYMDEAERCHRLAYIAYGKLLITGTADEVIAHSRLTTWAVTGPDLFALAAIDRRAAHGRAELAQH